MSPLQGVLRPFSDICHSIYVIQVAPDSVRDPPRRLNNCMFGLQTAFFHLKYQGNWVHMKDFFIPFHMRYSSLLSDKQGPDLRYLRRAIRKGRDFSDSGILVQIADVLMNFVVKTKLWNFMRTTIIWLFSGSWIFGLFAKKMVLQVNFGLEFGVCCLCSIFQPFHSCSYSFIHHFSHMETRWQKMEIPSAFYKAKWIFGLLALRMALKVNSDHKFKIYGLCFLC